MSIALIDADSLIYRSGFTFEDKTTWNEIELELGTSTVPDTSVTSDILLAKNAIDAIIDNIKFKTGCDEVELWVSGSDNFRYNVMSDYKHNRTMSRKPLEYDNLYKYLLTKYGAKVAIGYEADDMVVYLKTTHPLQYVLCAIDKDVLYQTEGNHYNYNKDEFISVSKEEAIRFFWFQVLTGDTTDGYSGCKGIGKVKANRILDEVEEESLRLYSGIIDIYGDKVLQVYEEAGLNYDDFIATCRVANMHQLIENNGTFSVNLFEH